MEKEVIKFNRIDAEIELLFLWLDRNLDTRMEKAQFLAQKDKDLMLIRKKQVEFWKASTIKARNALVKELSEIRDRYYLVCFRKTLLSVGIKVILIDCTTGPLVSKHFCALCDKVAELFGAEAANHLEWKKEIGKLRTQVIEESLVLKKGGNIDTGKKKADIRALDEKIKSKTGWSQTGVAMLFEGFIFLILLIAGAVTLKFGPIDIPIGSAQFFPVMALGIWVFFAFPLMLKSYKLTKNLPSISQLLASE